MIVSSLRNADNGSSGNLHINQQGQGNGQRQKKPNTVTQQRKATETGKKSEHPKQSKQRTRATPAGRTAEATSFPTKSENDRITVVVGDSIIKNLQGRKLAKAVGHRVVGCYPHNRIALLLSSCSKLVFWNLPLVLA